MALYEITPTNMQGSGFFFKGRAGENMLRGKLVYKAADGAWYLADADLAAETPALGLTMGRANAGQIVRILKEGYLGRSDWAWVVGGEIYTSGTPGELTQVAAGLVQVVGMATRSDMISFDPEGSVGAGGVVCALLEGHTAYVGFDICKGANYTNYFTCDGVADDVQVAAAIAYVVGLGLNGSVFVEEGVYHMTARISVPEQISIFGTGDSTRFEKDFNGSEVFELSSVTLEGQILRDFMIDGNKATQTGTGIQCLVSRNVIIQNIRIIQCEEYGVEVFNAWGAVIKDCTIEYCGVGIHKSGTGNALLVDNCVLRFCDSHGAFLDGGNDHKIINSIIEKTVDQFGTGVRIDSGDYVRILNNSFEDFPADGRCVFINGSTATVVEARIAYNEMSEDNICIEVDDATNTRIYQNSLFGVGTGIDITANATLTHIFDNDNNAATRLVDLGTDTHVPMLWIPVTDPNSTLGDHPAVVMPDDSDTSVYFQINMPLDYNEIVTLQTILVAAASGNLRHSTNTDFGKLCASEDYNTHSDAVAAAQIALTLNDLECVDISAAFTVLAGGDLVGVQFNRLATNVLDTINDVVYFLGARVRYI